MDLSGIGKHLGRVDRVGPKGRAAGAPAERVAGESDQVDLSSEASEVLSGYDAVRDLAAASPPVREERVREVRVRIGEGFYDRPDIRRAVATRLAESFFALTPRLA
jgi:hypothetical protein